MLCKIAHCPAPGIAERIDPHMKAACEQYCSANIRVEDHHTNQRGDPLKQGAATMNPITLFLTALCAAGAALGAI